MTDNLAYWNWFADVDPKFTKAITGKAYKGTSPNPQYVIKCLTEMFGPVGTGFGWNVVAEGFIPLGDEVLHWCRIQFWHTDRANHFESYGQTKALMKTRNGPMLDEDAPKKSLTDAITKAASHIGVAANIFLGRWDDAKYVAQVAADYAEGHEVVGAGTNPVGDMLGFRAQINAAIENINAQTDLEGLGAYWKALTANARGVALDAEVTKAKDAKKEALTREAA